MYANEIMKTNEQLEKELADALALMENLKRQLTLALTEIAKL